MIGVSGSFRVVEFYFFWDISALRLYTSLRGGACDHGLCRPSPYLEIQAVELAADGPDKLIHNIC